MMKERGCLSAQRGEDSGQEPSRGKPYFPNTRKNRRREEKESWRSQGASKLFHVHVKGGN